MIKVDTIKRKYKALNHKKSFVELMAEKLGMNSDYLTHVWFQGKFKIPQEKLAFVDEELDKRKVFESKKEEMLKSLEAS